MYKRNKHTRYIDDHDIGMNSDVATNSFWDTLRYNGNSYIKTISSSLHSFGGKYSHPYFDDGIHQNKETSKGYLDERKPQRINVNQSKERYVSKGAYFVLGSLLALVVLLGIALGLGFGLSNRDGQSSDRDQERQDTTLSPNDMTTQEYAVRLPLPAIIAHTLNIEDFEGDWTVWSAWSTCTASCDGGRKWRERQCDQEKICLGIGFQKAPCNERPCPHQVGLWSSWATWGECSQECGGGNRTRARSCADEGIVCPGDADQTEHCNTYECPDCSRECSEGVLVDCTYCSCPSSVRTGKVIDAGPRIPLKEVTVSHETNPNVIFALTNSTGSFTLYDVCSDTQLRFYKDGYLEVTVVVDDIVDAIEMTQREALEAAVNPDDKTALIGESITFKCSMVGRPPPKYYEWFKNDEVIYTEYTNGESNLSLEQVTSSDNGIYKCRASNAFSSRYSMEASLTVKSAVYEFCVTTPQEHFEKLPTNCLYKGENKIDIGKCHSGQCPVYDHNIVSEDVKGCCGPIETFELEMNCTYATPIFHVVTKCGCQSCSIPKTHIQGKVFSAANDYPISDTEIIFDKGVVAVTDQNGTFEFAVESRMERISITTRTPISSGFIDTTKTVYPGPIAGGVQMIVLKLLPRPDPVTFEAIDGVQSLPIASGDINLGFISIPPNAIYDEDGNIFDGEVAISLSTIQPDDLESMDLAPGEFTAINDEGEPQLLTSYGMFGMQLMDTDGHPLQSPDDITINIPIENIDADTDEQGNSVVKLWTMNENSGRWEFASGLTPTEGTTRAKREGEQFQVTIRGVSLNHTWYNLGAITTMTCFSKIRVFESDGRTPIHNARVGVIQQNGVRGNSISYVRAASDVQFPENGYCIGHPCKNDRRDSSARDTRGLIVVNPGSDQSPFTPRPLEELDWRKLASDLDYEDEPGVISTRLHLSDKERQGPFYDWHGSMFSMQSQSCTYADRSEKSFAFIAPAPDCEMVYPNPYIYATGDSGTCNTIRYRQLHNFAKVIEGRVESCFIKVYAPDFGDSVYIAAVSRIGCASNEFVGQGDLYGSTYNCLRSGYTCLEVKTPDGASCNATDVLNDSYTHVSIIPVLQHMALKAVHPIFDQLNINVFGDDGYFAFAMTYDLVAEAKRRLYTGIYCETGPTVEVARKSAKERCFGSPQHAWAVQFGEKDN